MEGRLCTICNDEPQLTHAVRGARCQKLFNALREHDAAAKGTDKRRAPTVSRLRAAVLGDAYVETAALDYAGHPSRAAAPRNEEVEAALGVLRDHRAQRQGKPGYVYLIIEVRPGGGLRYGKIGYSTNPLARVGELQAGNPRPLALHLAKPGTEADERALHARYIDHNTVGEWFRITKELLLEFPGELPEEIAA